MIRLTVTTLIPLAAFHLRAQVPRSTPRPTDPGAEAFLARAYTVRDHAVDVLRADAIDWASKASFKRDFAKEFVTPSYGMNAHGTAYIDPKSRDVIVSVDYGVSRVVGDREKVCASQLRILGDFLFGSGKDVRGRDIRAKTMIGRFGTPASVDTAGASAAAAELLRNMKLGLLIIETDSKSYVSCWQDVASGTLHSGALPNER